jgi:hypothetical protein
MTLINLALLKKGSEVLLECIKCGEKFLGVSIFTKHMIDDHKSKSFISFKCCGGKYSTSRSQWLQHLTTEHKLGERPLPCSESKCPESFKNMDRLRKHLNNQHSSGLYYCESHSKALKNRQQWLTHQRRYETLCTLKRNTEIPASFPAGMQGPSEVGNRVQSSKSSARFSLIDLPGRHPQKHNEAFDEEMCKLLEASKLTGPAKEVVQPFLSLVEILPPVTKVVNEANKTNSLDGTTPIHWATNDLFCCGITKAVKIVLLDMNRARSAIFRSGSLTDTVNRADVDLKADVMAHMLEPNPSSLDLVYAANVTGQSSDSPIRVPKTLLSLRHLDENNFTKKYSSNITPQGVVFDLHQGECYQL